jgi:hypothetical protein
LLTTDNLYDEETLKYVEQGAAELVSRVEKYGSEVPHDTAIVLGVGWSKGEYIISYYLASASQQAVFWMEEVPADIVTLNDRIAVSQTHLGKPIYSRS